jgi:hypothetical protein
MVGGRRERQKEGREGRKGEKEGRVSLTVWELYVKKIENQPNKISQMMMGRHFKH